MYHLTVDIAAHPTTEWFAMFAEPMVQLGISHLADSEKEHILILDLGCGRGQRAPILHTDDRFRVIGLDINRQSLRHARSRYPDASYVHGDIEKLPFADATFDAIFSFSVLQYVDWQTTIRQCKRILKPKGRAVFVENLSGNVFAKGYRMLHRALGWTYATHMTPKRHIRWHELSVFRSEFQSVTCTPFHLMTPAALVIPTIRYAFSGKPLQITASGLYRFLRATDRCLLKRVPFLARGCWMIAICITTTAESGVNGSRCPANAAAAVATDQH